MTLTEFLSKIAGISGPALVAFLERVATELPDLKPMADEWIAALNTALTPENLVAAGTTALSELSQIGQGKFSGRPHPSDL